MQEERDEIHSKWV